MKRKTPDIVCKKCGETLYHSKAYCPKFPVMYDYYGDGKPMKKWKECVCFAHLCYEKEENGT